MKKSIKYSLLWGGLLALLVTGSLSYALPLGGYTLAAFLGMLAPSFIILTLVFAATIKSIFY